MPPVRTNQSAYASDEDAFIPSGEEKRGKPARKSALAARNVILNSIMTLGDDGSGISSEPRANSVLSLHSSLRTSSPDTSLDYGNHLAVSATAPSENKKQRKTATSGPFSDPITVGNIELRPTVAFKTFWWFAAERKAIDDRRRAGEPAPWTDNTILQNYFFCNTFRVLDKVCQYLIREVIEKGPQADEEVVFRVILFNLFTKIDTWELLERKLGPLRYKTYNRDQYAEVLRNANMTLYTGAFIKPAPKFGHDTNYENHLSFLEVLMKGGIVKICKSADHLADVFEWLVSFPSLGDFSTYQLMLGLSYTKVLNFHRNDFVVTGPGSISGLKKLFGTSIEPWMKKPGFAEGVMRYMVDNQAYYFQQGGFNFNGLGPKELPMDISDIEHTLCEVDKYCRAAHPGLKGKRVNLHRNFQPSPHPTYQHKPAILPKAWDNPKRRTPRVRKDKVLVVDKRYAIEQIVDHRQGTRGREFLVRWEGYAPRFDTWETEEHLATEAPEALAEYKARQGL